MFEIDISKKQLKFIESLPSSELIIKKIRMLKFFKDKPLNLDIKKMKGNWHGFYRMRIGEIRIIFYQKDEFVVSIHRIGFRGKIYK